MTSSKVPKLYPCNVIVSLILMFVIQVEVQQELEWKGSGLGSMAYGRLCGVFMCTSHLQSCPLVSSRRNRMRSRPTIPTPVSSTPCPTFFYRRWRRLMTCSRRGLSRVAPFFAEEDAPAERRRGADPLPYCAAFVLPGHLPTAPGVGVAGV